MRLPLAERMGFEPMCDCSQTDFESSWQNRTWRNLTEDNGRCENPENAVFSRLFAPVRIEKAVKIRVRKSPPISPSSNGFSEKPIRIFDRTERFFVPKSRFWQCVKRPGYAGLHPKSCRLIRFLHGLPCQRVSLPTLVVSHHGIRSAGCLHRLQRLKELRHISSVTPPIVTSQ